MLPTNSVFGIQFDEAQRFEKNPEKQNRLIGLLFCRPELDLMKNEIIPSLPYFHARSGGNTAFYFAGFETVDDFLWHEENTGTATILPVKEGQSSSAVEIEGQLSGEQGYFTVQGPLNRHWYFVPKSFNRFRADMQKMTRWEYSGGCDMLLLDSRRAMGLDFRSALVIRLDKIKEFQATPNVGQLFEVIFQYAEQQDEISPTWGLSDYLGIKTAQSGVWDAILSLLPSGVRGSVRAARHFVVRDIGIRDAFQEG
jgi:hypothetical protein